MKLDLGAGGRKLTGFTPVEIKDGRQAFPLDYPDGSASEIRASHVLEHFGHGRTAAVLAEWVRVLKPGGLLRVAVPDFDYVVRRHRAGVEGEPLEGYLFGGQTDPHDLHKALFTRDKLKALLEGAGLEKVRGWQSEANDCAALPVSLNLQGRKPSRPASAAQPPAYADLQVAVCISRPRLTFADATDTFWHACHKLNVRYYTAGGAYWGQSLERVMMSAVENGADVVVTMDYDTLFTREDLLSLLRLLAENPEADAIAPVQQGRSDNKQLFSMKDAAGMGRRQVDRVEFAQPLVRASTAHFGLTAIRASALEGLPHPWFLSQPNVEGTWGHARTDADIWFWRQWEKAGKSLYIATRVVVGHLELMVRWPDKFFNATLQEFDEWRTSKKPPADAWPPSPAELTGAAAMADDSETRCAAAEAAGKAARREKRAAGKKRARKRKRRAS